MPTWEQKYNERPGRTSAIWVIGAVVFFLLLGWTLSAAVLGINVATAGIVGKANVHIQNQSAGNRIVQQAGFETAWADVRKYDQQVKDAAVALADWDKANVGKADNAVGTLAAQRMYLASVVTGLKQQCQTTVENYNADARKTLAMDWRAADLPSQIEIADHCKER